MAKSQRNDSNVFLNWGTGINSTAIIALYLLGILEGKSEVVFADTGGELSEAYTYIDQVRADCRLC